MNEANASKQEKYHLSIYGGRSAARQELPRKYSWPLSHLFVLKRLAELSPANLAPTLETTQMAASAESLKAL